MTESNEQVPMANVNVKNEAGSLNDQSKLQAHLHPQQVAEERVSSTQRPLAQQTGLYRDPWGNPCQVPEAPWQVY